MKRPETAQETFLYQHQQYKRKIHFLRIFIFMVFLVLWELAADLSWINDFIFSSPKRLVTCFVQMLMEGIIWQHVSITLLETMISFVLVIHFYHSDCQFCSGQKNLSLMYQNRYMVVLNSLPKSALAPLLIVMAGRQLQNHHRHRNVCGNIWFHPQSLSRLSGCRSKSDETD